LGEHSRQLGENGLAPDELVFGYDHRDNVGADTSSGKGTDEHVRVQKNPQETSRKTSSSVRYPAASAKGIIRLRRSSNCETASWRRRASRTISLRERPLRLAARSSCFSRSGSSRIVSAEVFMYDNV